MARPRRMFKKAVANQVVRGYQKGIGLVALAAEAETSVDVIRRLLVENGVSIRPRGRPAAKK